MDHVFTVTTERYVTLLKVRGKQIRRCLETQDLALARRRLADLRRDLERTDPTLAGRTIESNAERYLATLTGAPSSQVNSRRSMARLLASWPRESPRAIMKIRRSDCELFLAQYTDLSASTINHMITDLTRFFELAVQDGVIPRNPMEGIKYRRIPKLTRLTPTREQFEALVKDLRSQQSNGHGAEDSADFVGLAGLLGLGQAELSGISRQHINLDTGTIQVFRRKTSQAFTIPIYPQARTIIERRLAQMIYQLQTGEPI